jgi:DNA-binding transcriptional ArsR family regulator
MVPQTQREKRVQRPYTTRDFLNELAFSRSSRRDRRVAKPGGRKRKKNRQGEAARKKAKTAKRKTRAADEAPAELIGALNHRSRRDILRHLHASKEPLSPSEMAKLFREPLSTVGYHANVLVERGGIVLVKTEPVRGAVEHFYASKVADNQAVKALLEVTRKSDKKQKESGG